MSSERRLSQLLQDLRSAERLEPAARATLQAVIDQARHALHDSGGKGRVLRAMLHLRPDEGYKDLVVVEARGTPPGGEDPRPSGTAWQLLQRLLVPVEVDVEALTFQPRGGELAELNIERDVGPFRSQQLLKERHATHILSLPLVVRGKLVGLVALEVNASLGRRETWEMYAAADGDALQLLVDVAAPVLLELPGDPGQPEPTDAGLPVVGRAMSPVMRILRRFARTESTVLLRGPTGVGKTRLASWCHDNSPRARAHFVVADLHAIPHELVEGTLFGAVKGSYTGADRDLVGLVAEAEGGTLFLDEIDKVPLPIQGKLLRLLDERRYLRVGDPRRKLADVRFILASNADLEALVREGRFLEDLYHRINVLPVRIPPLDQRLDEIEGWVTVLAREVSGTSMKPTDEAVAALCARSWPGNLRQLRVITERAVRLAEHPDRLEGSDFELAFALDGAPGMAEAAGLGAELDRLAARFASQAFEEPGTLTATLASRFEDFVFVAAERLYGTEEACRILGMDSLIKHRNHSSRLRKAHDRRQEVLATLKGS